MPNVAIPKTAVACLDPNTEVFFAGICGFALQMAPTGEHIRLLLVDEQERTVASILFKPQEALIIGPALIKGAMMAQGITAAKPATPGGLH